MIVLFKALISHTIFKAKDKNAAYVEIWNKDEELIHTRHFNLQSPRVSTGVQRL
jgi:hypothetical protein